MIQLSLLLVLFLSQNPFCKNIKQDPKFIVLKEEKTR